MTNRVVRYIVRVWGIESLELGRAAVRVGQPENWEEVVGALKSTGWRKGCAALVAGALSGFVGACGSQTVGRGAGTDGAAASGTTAAGAGADFSGHWEMDYGRSENVNRKLQAMLEEWKRQAERRAIAERRAMSERRRGRPPAAFDSAPQRFNRVIAAARLADMISAAQVLEIVQDASAIEIKRENDFPLSCAFGMPSADGADNAGSAEGNATIPGIGAEACGWSGGDLLFRIDLPDGLSILHRMTRAAAGDRLRIATTVKSGTAPPFTLNRFYLKFEPLPEDYRCEYTLSRGQVCRSGPPS